MLFSSPQRKWEGGGRQPGSPVRPPNHPQAHRLDHTLRGEEPHQTGPLLQLSCCLGQKSVLLSLGSPSTGCVTTNMPLWSQAWAALPQHFCPRVLIITASDVTSSKWPSQTTLIQSSLPGPQSRDLGLLSTISPSIFVTRSFFPNHQTPFHQSIEAKTIARPCLPQTQGHG